MDQTNNLKTNESKPPYLIGILGLIPLVGFFVGIVLIILGITKYKNKKKYVGLNVIK